MEKRPDFEGAAYVIKAVSFGFAIGAVGTPAAILLAPEGEVLQTMYGIWALQLLLLLILQYTLWRARKELTNGHQDQRPTHTSNADPIH